MLEILLVEDNPNDAELTLHALRKNRIASRVEHVQDGAEALDFLFRRGRHATRETSEDPRLVLLDLKLPKLSGLEVLRTLKADPVTRKLPVVVLTSSREEPDVATAYELGVNSYIVKPVNFERFTSAVQDLGLYWMLLNQGPAAVPH